MRIEPTAGLVRGLVAGIAMLMVAGVAGAAVTPSEQNLKTTDGERTASTPDEGASSNFSELTEDSDSAAPATSETSAPAKSAASKPGSGGSSGPAPAAPKPGSAPAPAAAWTPPRDGVYEYKQGDEEPQEVTFTTTGKASGEVQQKVSGFGGSSGGGGEFDTSWNSSGWVWQRLSGSGSGQSVSCDFTPPLLFVPQPMAVGVKWTYDSTCTLTFGAESVKLRFQGSGMVSGVERVKVGSTEVDTWVIQREMTTEYSYNNKPNSSKSSSTEHWSPAHGLNVRSKGSQDGTTYERSLVSLNPK